MTDHDTDTAHCSVCHKDVPMSEAMPLEEMRPAVLKLVRQDNPGLPEQGFICPADLARYRTRYVEHALEEDMGEMTEIEKDVVESIKAHELLSENLNTAFDRQLTVGERMSDAIAEFGGSWTFILSFGGVLVVWVAVNSIVLAWRPFDPYPYILLNLVLSCLAALQAPIIMMSQNRQEDKDRLRSEYDYRINLKAELEIRHLNEKMDHLVMRQWQRLLEIQQIQTQLLQELRTGPGRQG